MGYKPKEGTKCLECGKDILEDDDYFWVKSKGHPGEVSFIHKSCYATCYNSVTEGVSNPDYDFDEWEDSEE